MTIDTLNLNNPENWTKADQVANRLGYVLTDRFIIVYEEFKATIPGMRFTNNLAALGEGHFSHIRPRLEKLSMTSPQSDLNSVQSRQI